MTKYTELVKQILTNIGGPKNIIALQHCFTRLRFILKNEDTVQEEKLKDIEGVLQVVKSGGQYQIIIGTHVKDVFDELCAVSGYQPTEESKQPEKKRKPLGIFMEYVQAIMFPVVFVMSACAIINGFNVLAKYTGLYTQESGIYILLSGLGNAVLYLMPVFLGYNTAKKLNIDPFIGLTIGAALCNPNINGVDINLMGATLNVTYTSTILPAVFTVFLAAPIAKYLQKQLPAVIRAIFVPLITLLIAVPVGFCLVGPIANTVGNGIGEMINNLIELNSIIAGFFVGGFYNIFVVLGIHGAISVPSLTNIFAGIPDSFAAMRAGVCFTMAAASLAIFIKTKNKTTKNIALPAAISGVFGITEPALYGLAVPRIRVFIGICLAGGLGGITSGILGAKAYGIGSGGIFQVAGYINPADPSNSLMAILITFMVNIIAGFVITWILYKDDDSSKLTELKIVKEKVETLTKEKQARDVLISSPIKGILSPLSSCVDPAFAQGTLGKGALIIPNDETMVAPFDGTVTTLFNSLHAIGLTSEDGVELLIHIGIDTVRLQGQCFEAYVKQGEYVKKGTPLVKFNIKAIEKAGYAIETPIIITNSKDYTDVIVQDKENVTIYDNIFLLIQE